MSQANLGEVRVAAAETGRVHVKASVVVVFPSGGKVTVATTSPCLLEQFMDDLHLITEPTLRKEKATNDN